MCYYKEYELLHVRILKLKLNKKMHELLNQCLTWITVILNIWRLPYLCQKLTALVLVWYSIALFLLLSLVNKL